MRKKASDISTLLNRSTLKRYLPNWPIADYRAVSVQNQTFEYRRSSISIENQAGTPIRSHYTHNKNKDLRPIFLPEITQIVNDETEKRQILEGNPKEIRAVKRQA